MRFVPYVVNSNGDKISVVIRPMQVEDAQRTIPNWQTSWTSEYLSDDHYDKYAFVNGEELIALGAYEILESSLVVHIVYMEAQPESNPTITFNDRKYSEIGRLLIAFGIKLSVDHGFGGDVVLEAKTPELAKHYMQSFGAVKLPVFSACAPRFLIADEAAKRIFFNYLES